MIAQNPTHRARRPRLLWAWIVSLLWVGSALAQAPVSGQAPQNVAADAVRALEWIAKPAREQRLEAFAPAADIHCRVYQTPRPLRMWIARVDLTVPGVRLTVTEPAELTVRDARYETLCANTLEFAMQRGVQLAVNSSAFDPFRSRAGLPMDVVGLAAVRGRLYSEPDPRFGAMYVSRDGQIALKGPPLPSADVWQVVPGFRMLVDDGRMVVPKKVAQTKFGGLNPRTAVGVDRAGGTLWIVVVDGRQPGVSTGMTLVELACLFQTLDVWDALNLDGGGSSTLVLENVDCGCDVVNTPVGRRAPGTLRQVANNLGLYLPGRGPQARPDRPATLRDAVIRLAATRRGGRHIWAGDGVCQDIVYDGETVLRGNPKGTYCCGATLELFLDAYCLVHHRCRASAARGRWFEGWSREKFRALQQGWYGTESAAKNPHIPAQARPTIREKQVYHILTWSSLGQPVQVRSVGTAPSSGRAPYRPTDHHQLQRGDFVEFWRKSGSGHSAVFWGRDRDQDGRERLWYWSSQPKPRHAYALEPGGKPTKTPGYGINWEYVGEEIDPARIYGVRLVGPSQP